MPCHNIHSSSHSRDVVQPDNVDLEAGDVSNKPADPDTKSIPHLHILYEPC